MIPTKNSLLQLPAIKPATQDFDPTTLGPVVNPGHFNIVAYNPFTWTGGIVAVDDIPINGVDDVDSVPVFYPRAIVYVCDAVPVFGLPLEVSDFAKANGIAVLHSLAFKDTTALGTAGFLSSPFEANGAVAVEFRGGAELAAVKTTASDKWSAGQILVLHVIADFVTGGGTPVADGDYYYYSGDFIPIIPESLGIAADQDSANAANAACDNLKICFFLSSTNTGTGDAATAIDDVYALYESIVAALDADTSYTQLSAGSDPTGAFLGIAQAFFGL
jgi:hypothetical protein